MYKFFVLFVLLFSFSVFAQSSLLDYGSAGISGSSYIENSFHQLSSLTK
ncbi:MAG: hypothetical protein IPH11_12390 [Ignavibacteriales bacterium]|nr:hypothetical protein [Ignavibacteriales bacterium]